MSVSGVSRFSKVSEKQERAFVSSEQPWNSLGKLLSIQRGLEPVLSAVITLPGVGVLLDGFVVGVEGGFEEKDGSNSAGHLLDVANFVFRKRAAEKGLVAVGEPLLDDLIAADGVMPDSNGNIRPVGDVVEVDIAGVFAEMFESVFLGEAESAGTVENCFALGLGVITFQEFAFARHGDAAFAGVAPPCFESELGFF